MSNESRSGLYIDLLMIVRYSHEAWDKQTQSHLLEKTHQSNSNLCKNDSVLMPKGEFKLAPNPNPARLGSVRVCDEPSMS